jgi:hypothetical protein
MKRIILYLGLFLLITGLISGCSSMKYVKRAQSSFDDAKAAGAENGAPFEYYAAEEYLELSEHENDEGDHSQAQIFADESEKYSAEALKITGGGAK